MRNFPIHDCASIGGSHQADCQLAISRGTTTPEAGDYVLRTCRAWLDCGNTEISTSLVSARGFCPDCEAVANS